MAGDGVVMMVGPDESSRWVFHALDRAVGVRRVIEEQPVPRLQFLRRRAKSLGWSAVAGQILFMAFVTPWLRREAAARAQEIRRTAGLDPAPIPDNRLIRVPSVNAPETLDRLRDLDPAVVVLNGTRIVARRVLEALPCPFLNMHAGITPLYRGVHGAYWALADGRPDACGVTVHLVDPGIDTGGIVAQALITPAPTDNFTTYPALQVAAGIPLMIEAVRAALEGRLATMAPPPGPSRLWHHPTAWQYLDNRWRRGIK
jgi:folate-dependent phosphoribosylglycinamide formyltransferase PurN